METSETKTLFSEFGRTHQEKILQALIQDSAYADQMSDVLDPKYFSLLYLQEITKKVFEHHSKYRESPSIELIEIMLRQDEDASSDDILMTQAREFLARSKSNPLNGDMRYIQDNSLEFCRRQELIRAMSQCLDKVDEKDYDSINRIVKDALNRGAPRDAGHEYNDNLSARVKKNIRQPIATGWPPIDKVLNGGLERGTLTTFIAPTGAGKSMFLVNVACSIVEQGLNVLYVTLEMAEWKIGLRADSYYTGIAINEVPDNEEKVREIIGRKAKGRLIIKEWPTKMATPQTLRSHLQKLEQTKEFKADCLILDYADLLRGTRSYGEKRHELEGVYEELRAIGQEFNIPVVTADQTNRAGLNDDVVTLSSIAESYAKATVCDLIMTISRKMEDKQNGTGRLFVAKSRLGDDGMVFNFLLRPATVKVRVLDQSENPLQIMMGDTKEMQKMIQDRYSKLAKSADDR